MYFPGNLVCDATGWIKLVHFVINNEVITSVVEKCCRNLDYNIVACALCPMVIFP